MRTDLHLNSSKSSAGSATDPTTSSNIVVTKHVGVYID